MTVMPLPLSIVPVPGPGAEDVLVGADGRVWTGTEDGAIHVHDPQDGSVVTVTATGGRPLGLEWLPDGRLLICDAHRGLLAFTEATGDLEVLASEVDGVPMLCTNNASVAADGTIWFSDSSMVWPVEQWKNDLVEHTRTGRLLRRSPDGDVVVVLSGLCFANGVTLTPDEDAVLVAETGTRAIRRVHLVAGEPRESTMWVEDLPGHPDNISLGTDGLVWVTIASPRDRMLALIQRAPRAVRGLVRRAPDAVQPSPKATVRVIAFHPSGAVVHDLDFDASDWHVATGVREHHGRVWLGSLVQPSIAVGDVPGAGPGPGQPLT